MICNLVRTQIQHLKKIQRILHYGKLLKKVIQLGQLHVLHEDRLQIVLANDGSVKKGLYLAQSAAASLNRVLKAQAASGIRADVHVHADGTVHASH